MGCTQSLHCWWSKAHTRKISRTEAICKSVGLQEPNNNEKKLWNWLLEDETWSVHTALKHVCSFRKATARSTASMKVARGGLTRRHNLLLRSLLSIAHIAFLKQTRNLFECLSENKYIESKHIEMWNVNKSTKSSASYGMREWIHTLIPLHSLPQMGASKPWLYHS